jgi:ELWxxDGT repeat protein
MLCLRRAMVAASVVFAMAVPTTQAAAVEPSAPYLVKDINPSGDSDPRFLTNVAGLLYFTADDGSHGRELWKSDGTQGGTRRVRDIRPGAAGSKPANLTNVHGTLFFSASDGIHGRELWKSDGTSGGTQMVKDIDSSGGSHPQALTVLGPTLYFSADHGGKGRGLWKTNGTAGGTKLVADIFPPDGYIKNLVVANGRVFFLAFLPFITDDASSATLYESDGTAAGTRSLPSPCPGDPVGGGRLVYFGTEHCFTNEPVELWRSNGTPGGTKGLGVINPRSVTNVRGTMFFGAGDQLDKSDGTAAGTVPVKDITQPLTITAVGHRAFVVAGCCGIYFGGELWVSDGTGAGTTKLRPRDCPTGLTDVGGVLYLASGERIVDDFGGYSCDLELWMSDGTKSGTKLVADLNAAGSSGPAELTNVGGNLYFSADDGINGRELRRYVP